MSEPPRETIDLANTILALQRGDVHELTWESGPPPRVNGYSISAPMLTRDPPHGGEMHPDGDELLLLISGCVTVELEDRDPPRRVELAPGQALIVPRGVWHRVYLREPSQVLYVSPGPGGEHRPLDQGIRDVR